jgi:hypothetical protein
MNPTETTSIEKSEPIVEKISENQVSITYTQTETKATEIVENLDYDFLLKQEEQIKTQRAGIRESLAKQSAENDALEVAEIAEVKARLAICMAHGLKTAEQVKAEAVALQEAVEAETPAKTGDGLKPIIP